MVLTSKNVSILLLLKFCKKVLRKRKKQKQRKETRDRENHQIERNPFESPRYRENTLRIESFRGETTLPAKHYLKIRFLSHSAPLHPSVVVFSFSFCFDLVLIWSIDACTKMPLRNNSISFCISQLLCHNSGVIFGFVVYMLFWISKISRDSALVCLNVSVCRRFSPVYNCLRLFLHLFWFFRWPCLIKSATSATKLVTSRAIALAVEESLADAAEEEEDVGVFWGGGSNLKPR